MKKFIIFILLTLPAVSFAADISFSMGKNIFAPSESFLVQVFLDTKDASVNAVEGVVVFPSNLLQLKEIRDGNSAVNFWIEKPHDVGDGRVAFSGITALGFSGPHKFLFGIVFQSKDVGNGSVAFRNIQVLQNDGLGTNIFTTETPLNFSVSVKFSGSSGADLTVKDTDPPENFFPSIGQDPNVFGGKYFVAFSAVDKGAGIDHYEIRESPWFFFGIWGGKYTQVESPYLLQDQTLKSSIYIAAIDKNGNTRTVKLEAHNKLALFPQYLIFGIILVACIFILKKIWLKFTH